MKSIFKKLTLITLLSAATLAQAESTIERHLNEGSTFPIAKAVTLKAGTDIIYLSGTVPAAFDETKDKNSVAYFGTMEQQTVSVLTRIESRLGDLGLTMKDVVKMQAFLVPDKTTQQADFSGFMKGYTQFFGTQAQPNLPSRSALNVHSLVNPGWLIEIEVVAAKSPM